MYRTKECVDEFEYKFKDSETGKIKKFKITEKRIVTFNPKLAKKQIYEINKEIVKKQKETFDKNIKVTLNKHKSDIIKYEKLLKKDDEIISIREKIISVTESQLDNGTITSTTYLTETNNLNQARLLQRTHYLQLLQSKINYLTTKGN